jgi:hypothetical protein
MSVPALSELAPRLLALQQRQIKDRGQQPLAAFIEAIPDPRSALGWPPLRGRIWVPH